jgi:phage shock protein PspC (stress-responsive transcriptional regulator)
MAKFRRTPQNSWFGGVCAGLAYSVGAPVWIVRLAWFLLAWFYGIGVAAYLLFWIFAPKWEKLPEDFSARTGD